MWNADSKWRIQCRSENIAAAAMPTTQAVNGSTAHNVGGERRLERKTKARVGRKEIKK